MEDIICRGCQKEDCASPLSGLKVLLVKSGVSLIDEGGEAGQHRREYNGHVELPATLAVGHASLWICPTSAEFDI